MNASAASLGVRARQHAREFAALSASLALHLAVIAGLAFLTFSSPRETPPMLVELLVERAPAAAEGRVVLAPSPQAAAEPAESTARAASEPSPPAPPESSPDPAPAVLRAEPAPAVEPEPLSEAVPLPEAPAVPPRPKPRPVTLPTPDPKPAPAIPELQAATDARSDATGETAPAPAIPAPAKAPATAPSSAAPVPPSPPPAASYGSVLLRWLERYRDYPRAARLRRIEGVVVLRLTIERSGKLVEATIAESSGSPLLDDAAMEMVRRALPLPPLPQGDAIEHVVMLVPIAYKLG